MPASGHAVLLERASPAQLLSRGNASAQWAWVQLGLFVCNAVNGDQQEEEEERQDSEAFCCAGDDAAIPCEEGELIQADDQVEAGGRIPQEEDGKGEGRDGVH